MLLLEAGQKNLAAKALSLAFSAKATRMKGGSVVGMHVTSTRQGGHFCCKVRAAPATLGSKQRLEP